MAEEVQKGRMLAQSRPSNTSATSIYSPPSSMVTEITRIVVVNTSAGNDTFRIFLDDDGTTYDETTALFWDEALNADTARVIDADWWLDNPNGNLAVRVGTGNAITFTAFGIEHAR